MKNFNGLYLSDFTPTDRDLALYDKVKKYYTDSEHLDNRAAMVLYKELKQWIRLGGYSNEEYNQVKRRVTGEI